MTCRRGGDTVTQGDAKGVELRLARFQCRAREPERTPHRRCSSLSIQGAWVSPYSPLCEAVYDAGPAPPDRVVLPRDRGRRRGLPGNATFNLFIQGGPDGRRHGRDPSSDSWAGLEHHREATSSGRAGSSTRRSPTAPPRPVLTVRRCSAGPEEPGVVRRSRPHGDKAQLRSGYAASDVITDIAKRFCPTLDTSGVQQDYVADPLHLVFKDWTAPYDVFLAVRQRPTTCGSSGCGRTRLLRTGRYSTVRLRLGSQVLRLRCRPSISRATRWRT